jgi:START domain-containing protein
MSKMLMSLLLSLISVGVGAQTDWQLKKDEDGIKVFTSSTPNSNFKSVKVECTVKATPSQLIAFLLDVEKQHEWIYNNKCSQVVKQIGSNEMISYSEYSIPWPCCNRDYVAHVTISRQTPQLITIDSYAEPDLLPAKQGKVRVKKSVSHWDVTELSNELLKIVYTVHCDPAGSIPAWLTNMYVTKGPYQTFQKLRDQVNKPQYQNARIDFIR